jgi:hypothetical protein
VVNKAGGVRRVHLGSVLFDGTESQDRLSRLFNSKLSRHQGSGFA